MAQEAEDAAKKDAGVDACAGEVTAPDCPTGNSKVDVTTGTYKYVPSPQIGFTTKKEYAQTDIYDCVRNGYTLCQKYAGTNHKCVEDNVLFIYEA